MARKKVGLNSELYLPARVRENVTQEGAPNGNWATQEPHLDILSYSTLVQALSPPWLPSMLLTLGCLNIDLTLARVSLLPNLDVPCGT